MQIKKLLKYLPVTIMAAGIVLATTTPTLFSVNNGDSLNNLVFNTSQQNGNTDYSDQLEYIRNDVTKQTGVTNSIASIKLADSSSSTEHTAAVVTKTDGSTLLYMWGYNGHGQLGNDTKVSTSTPTLVDSALFGSKEITQIAVGGNQSAVLLDDGSLYMWGQNNYGQLGNGTTDNAFTPTKVIGLDSKKITQIALGDQHSAALLEDGNLYMWGYNYYGQLGFTANGYTPNHTPAKVASLSGKKIAQIVLGGTHSAAHLDDGSLYMWGYNGYGQLGNNINTSSDNPNPIPTPVIDLSGQKIRQIELGYNHSAALLEDGTLYMWGQNYDGQLGNGKNDTVSPTLTLVDSTPFGTNKITEVALGHTHSAALLDDGSLYMWGQNNSGQLGNGTQGRKSTPVQVDSTPFASKKIIQIALGSNHSAAYLEDGSLYMWGDNASGQLGFTAKGIVYKTTPTWMSQLGKDSHITGKYIISAEQAVENLWVDNKFNLVGFKNSFNLINIPDATDQIYEIDTKPTYNNVAGTVTMNIKIKYFYNENGLIVADTAATPMIISGFMPGPNRITDITAKNAVVDSVVADKWLSYVTVDEKINRTKLEDFLTLTEVPADAEFTITNLNSINKTGVLTFNISTNKITYDNGDVRDVPSDLFPITLNLTPRITAMTPKASGYLNNLTVAELKAKLFNEDGLVIDPIELQNYLTIVAPVDNTTYHLVEGTWNPKPIEGTVGFDIYASKYYDENTDEQTGTATNAGKVTLNLQLQREASTIALKIILPDIRVDKFEDYIKSSGTTVASSRLGEFFDLTNIPSDATFSIANVKIDKYNADYVRDHLTFDLTIDKFNQGTPVTLQTYSHNYGLTLTAQHLRTSIATLPVSVYPQDLTPDQFKQRLQTDGAVVADDQYTLSATNIAFLKKFLAMQSVPVDATTTLTFVSVVDTELTFNLVIDKYYDADSELSNTAQPYNNLTLKLMAADQPINPPTEITAKTDAEAVDTPEDFLNSITNADGSYNRTELSKYINGLGTIPTDGVITIVQDGISADGTAHFTLKASKYYNGTDADPQLNGEFKFTVKTNQVAPAPTTTEESFPWWWILAGVGGAVIIGIGAWLVIKKPEPKKAAKTSNS